MSFYNHEMSTGLHLTGLLLSKNMQEPSCGYFFDCSVVKFTPAPMLTLIHTKVKGGNKKTKKAAKRESARAQGIDTL